MSDVDDSHARMEDALNHEKSDKQREALSWMDNKPIHYV